MIAEAGLSALWLAAGLAALQALLMILALRTDAEVARPMRAIAVLQGALTLLAFAMLLMVFARSDMSVALVFENSNSAKPFIYKVAGAWGNHEGSMLMWVTILAVAGAFLAFLARRTGERTLLAALPSLASFPRLSTAGGSIRCFRTQAWPFIRRRCTSAMSACRWRSASLSVRCLPVRWTPASPGRCGPGCSARGFS